MTGTPNRSDAAPEGWQRIVPALAVGSMSGLGLLVAQLAFATLVFSGPLAPYSSQGVGLILFGNFAGCLIVALASGYRGAIAGLSPALVVMMAQMGSTIEAEGEALFATAVGAFMIAAAGMGSLCILIGTLRWANAIRFIPHPVACGFVAGIGGVVCLSALSLGGADLATMAVPDLFEPAALSKWVPSVLYGGALYATIRRWRNPLILPVSVVLLVGGYQAVMALAGMSAEQARQAGHLIAISEQGSLWPAFGPDDLALVDWTVIAAQLPNLLVLGLVALILTVMSLAGLEVALGEDLDWNREFRAAGSASVVAGLSGGTFVSMIVPASYRSKLLGASTRVTGSVCALVIGGALFFGGGLLQIMPVSVVAGFLLFAGIGMIAEGLVRSRRRLPMSEYGIVILICGVTVAFGLVEGVAVGMLAALVFFSVRFSRVDPIAGQFTGSTLRSGKVRSLPDRAILLECGAAIQGCRLSGYLFFGSAWPLTAKLKQSLEGPEPPTCLVLDLQAVSGFDFSAVSVLGRFFRAAAASGVQVVLSASSESLRSALARNLPPAVMAGLSVERNEERALERCEDLVLEAWEAQMRGTGERRDALLLRTAVDLERRLERQAQFEDLMERLEPWLAHISLVAGKVLRGGGREDLLLLTEGRVSVYDAGGERLRQCAAGDPVGPLAAIDGRAARAIADEPCRAVALEAAAWRRLEQQDPQLALELYRHLFVSRVEAEPPLG